MTEGVYYNIEKILERRKANGRFEYKIKWEGYPMSQSTWEPMTNLETAKELVDEFDRLHPIPTNQKSSKSSNKTFTKKKRKNEKLEDENKNENKVDIKENNSNDAIKVNEEESKKNINENKNEKIYIIDDNLKRVTTVKQQNQTLLAVVEKISENGEIEKIYIPTEELRKSNPWILLDFYESKIKFT